jgi:osmotically-inducible protein OsmY
VAPGIKVAIAALLLTLTACATQSPEDAKLEMDLKHNINSHTALLADHLTIRVMDKVAYISGEVSTWHEYYVVSEIAAKTPGLAKVINNTHEPEQY